MLLLVTIGLLLGSLHLSSTQSVGDTCAVAVCFATDESASIGSAKFLKARQNLVTDVIRGVSEIASEAQFGASRFGTTAVPVEGLSSMTIDASAATAAIKNTNHVPAQASNMEAGIAECYRVENGVRSGILTRNVKSNLRRLVLLLTAGKPNVINTASASVCQIDRCSMYATNLPSRNVCRPSDYRGEPFDSSACASEVTRQRAAAARADGIQIVSVGVGPDVDADFLGSLGEYYAVANHNDMQSVVEDVVAAVCSDNSRSNDHRYHHGLSDVDVYKRKLQQVPTPITAADLLLTKTVSSPTAILNVEFSYTITVTNTAATAVAENTLVVDTLPAGLVAVDSALPGGCTRNGQQVRCGPSTLNPGASVSYTIRVNSLVAGTFDNAAIVRAGPVGSTVEQGPVSSTVTVQRTCARFVVDSTTNAVQPYDCGADFRFNQANAASTSPAQGTCCVPLAPDVRLNKTLVGNNNGQVPIGSTVTYLVEISNVGDANSPVVALYDTIQAGLEFAAPLPAGCVVDNTGRLLTCGGLSLDAGETRRFEIPVTTTALGTLSNTAMVFVEVGSPPPVRTVVIEVIRTCLNYNSDGSRYPCNPGTEFNTQNAANTAPDQATCCQVIRTPDLRLSKTIVGEPDGEVLIGSTLTYLVEVSNVGNAAAADVTLIDTLQTGLEFVAPLPAGCTASGQVLTCGPFNLDAGVNRQFSITARAREAGSRRNTARLVQTNNVTALPTPQEVTIRVIRTCNNFNSDGSRFACGPGTEFVSQNADSTTPDQNTCCQAPLTPALSLRKVLVAGSSGGVVLIGSTLTYLVEVGNVGNAIATGVTVTDTLQAGLVFAALLPAGCTASGQVLTCGPFNLAALADRQFSILATATAPGSRTNTARVTVDSVTPPLPVEVTVNVIRTCNNFNSDGSRFNCRAGTEFITQNATDTAPDQAICCQVIRTPDLRLSKTIVGEPDGEVLIGSTLTYLVEVSNVGNAAAADVTLIDTLQTGLEFAAPLPAGCTASGQVLTCGPFSLAAGADRQFTIIARAREAGSRRNTARLVQTNNVTALPTPQEVITRVIRTCNNYNSDGSRFTCGPGTEFVPENANNITPDQSTCCQARRTPNLRLNKTVVGVTDGQVLIGSTVTYLVSVGNVGNATATSVTVTDTLQAGLVFAASLPAGCTASGQVLTCGPFNLAAGADRQFSIRATATAPGSRTNTARVSVDNVTPPLPVEVTVNVIRTCNKFNSDGSRFSCRAGTEFAVRNGANTSPNQATCCDSQAIGSPQLRLIKTIVGQPNGEVLIGSTVTYLVEVSNVGTAAAAGVVITDTLGTGQSFVTPLPEGCSASGQVLRCGPFALAAGATRQFRIRARATAPGRTGNTARVTAGGDTPPAEVTVIVIRTCRNFNSDGSRFTCSAGTGFNAQNATSTAPNQATCCQVIVTPVSELRLSKTRVAGDDPEVLIGSTLTYLVEVSNVGNADATDVIVIDTVQGGQAFAEPLPQGCTASGRVLRCGPFTLAAGATRQFRVTTTAIAPGRSRNTARVVVGDNVTTTPPTEQVIVDITRTCRSYNSDGSRFECPAGTAYDSDQDDNTTPRTTVCCSRGACCDPNGACTQVPRNQCRGSNTYTPAVTCRQASCSAQAPSLGACCGDGECEDGVLESECTARGGRLFRDRTCASNPGPRGTCSAANIPTGACCSNGDCEDGVAANVCRNRGGKAFIGRTCASRPGGRGVCAAAPTPTGSCCTRNNTCLAGVTRADCVGTWRVNGRCSAATCPAAYGACCVGTDQCTVVTAEGCAAVGGRFDRGKRCSAATCVAEVPGVCTPSWLPCFPCAGPTCTDTCCPGSTCQVAVTYNSQRYYACRPQATCNAEGQLCGDCRGGGVCCSGLICRWNFGSSTGRCVDPAATVCGYAGATCASDGDCCAGTRCGTDNRCRPATCNVLCARSSFKGKGCHIKQKHECKSLAAAAASSA